MSLVRLTYFSNSVKFNIAVMHRIIFLQADFSNDLIVWMSNVE